MLLSPTWMGLILISLKLQSGHVGNSLRSGMLVSQINQKSTMTSGLYVIKRGVQMIVGKLTNSCLIMA